MSKSNVVLNIPSEIIVSLKFLSNNAFTITGIVFCALHSIDVVLNFHSTSL